MPISRKTKTVKMILDLFDKSNNADIERSICDFIAGMTDRYAINLYNKIK